MALGEVTPVAGRAGREPGDLDELGEDVITVEAQQGVAVEEQRRDAADHGHVQSEIAQRPGLGLRPQHQRRRRESELGRDARRRHHDAAAALGEHARCGRVDVGKGEQHQELDPDLVHRAAPHAGGEAVPELVQQLHHDVGDRDQGNGARAERLRAPVGFELRPGHHGHREPARHQDEPAERSAGAEQRPRHGDHRSQQPVQVQQRDPHRERVGERSGEPARRAARWPVVAQEPGRGEPREQLRALGAPGGRVAQGLADLAERLGERAVAVEQRGDGEGALGHPVSAPAQRVVQHLPGLAAIEVAGGLDLRSQPRARGRERLPARRGLAHGTHRQVRSRSRSRSGPARIRPSDRSPTSIFAIPVMPGRSPAGGPSIRASTR